MATKKTLLQHANTFRRNEGTLMDYARYLADLCGVAVETARKWVYGAKMPGPKHKKTLENTLGPIRWTMRYL